MPLGSLDLILLCTESRWAALKSKFKCTSVRKGKNMAKKSKNAKAGNSVIGLSLFGKGLNKGESSGVTLARDKMKYDAQVTINDRTWRGKEKINNRTWDGKERINNRTWKGKETINDRSWKGKENIAKTKADSDIKVAGYKYNIAENQADPLIRLGVLTYNNGKLHSGWNKASYIKGPGDVYIEYNDYLKKEAEKEKLKKYEKLADEQIYRFENKHVVSLGDDGRSKMKSKLINKMLKKDAKKQAKEERRRMKQALKLRKKYSK